MTELWIQLNIFQSHRTIHKIASDMLDLVINLADDHSFSELSLSSFHPTRISVVVGISDGAVASQALSYRSHYLLNQSYLLAI